MKATFIIFYFIMPFLKPTTEDMALKKANDIIRKTGNISISQLDSIDVWYWKERKRNRVIPKF